MTVLITFQITPTERIPDVGIALHPEAQILGKKRRIDMIDVLCGISKEASWSDQCAKKSLDDRTCPPVTVGDHRLYLDAMVNRRRLASIDNINVVN